MRIYWFDEPSSGCGHVRVSLPMQELVRRGHRCMVGHGQFSIDTREWDAVALGRLPIGDIGTLHPEIRRRGLKVIYDIDDALDLLEPTNLSYAEITKHISAYFDLLRHADLVTVTTRELASHVRRFVPKSTDIVVLPNCIRPEEWKQRARDNLVPRIGFTGSHSRLDDLRWVLEAVKDLQLHGLRDKFEFVIFGISSSHGSFEEFYHACSNTPAHAGQAQLIETLQAIRGLLAQISHQWERAVPVEAYPGRLAQLNLDLGLCPLRPSLFNRHKSALKAYEYAMAGTEVLCSRAPPYADELPENLFSMVDFGVQEWRESLARWIRDFSAPDNVATANAQRDWVLAHKSIEKNGHLWESSFARILAKA